MNDRKERILLGQLKKRFDKNNNAYFIGDFGMSTMTIFPHKSKPDVFNIFISAKEFKKNEQNNENDIFPPVDFDNGGDIF